MNVVKIEVTLPNYAELLDDKPFIILPDIHAIIPGDIVQFVEKNTIWGVLTGRSLMRKVTHTQRVEIGLARANVVLGLLPTFGALEEPLKPRKSAPDGVTVYG